MTKLHHIDLKKWSSWFQISRSRASIIPRGEVFQTGIVPVTSVLSASQYQSTSSHRMHLKEHFQISPAIREFGNVTINKFVTVKGSSQLGVSFYLPWFHSQPVCRSDVHFKKSAWNIVSTAKNNQESKGANILLEISLWKNILK